MKTLRFVTVFLLLAVTSALGAPSMTVDKAASVAQQHLKERGLADSRFVSSLILERTSIGRGEQYWYARWSESVKLEEQKTEIGLRINMDGSLVRMVEGPGSKPKPHRARNDRPSILDLK
jgi:hypothetical protein